MTHAGCEVSLESSCWANPFNNLCFWAWHSSDIWDFMTLAHFICKIWFKWYLHLWLPCGLPGAQDVIDIVAFGPRRATWLICFLLSSPNLQIQRQWKSISTLHPSLTCPKNLKAIALNMMSKNVLSNGWYVDGTSQLSKGTSGRNKNKTILVAPILDRSILFRAWNRSFSMAVKEFLPKSRQSALKKELLCLKWPKISQ